MKLRAASGVLVLAVAVVVLGVLAGPAHADKVDDLVRDLKSGSDYKVRLSAALSLAKLGEKRAIPAFIVALSDKDKTVRGAAALALGKLVDARTSPAQRGQVQAALERVVARESSDVVKNQATKALTAIKAIGAADSGQVTGSVFIDVGPMASKAKDGDNVRLKDLMKRTTEKTFGSKGKDLMLAWPGGKSPSRKALDSKKVMGFHVDGTLTELVVKQKGSAATVSCKVSMLIATYPEKSVFGFLNGGASVTASSDESDIRLAGEDCLAAVVEDLVAKKIIPTIKIKAGAP